MRFLIQGTALVTIAGLVSAVPASALAVNKRPEVSDEVSVEGHDAVTKAIKRDVAVADANLKTLPPATWPGPVKVQLDDQAPDAFAAPTRKAAQSIALGRVAKDDAQQWSSPLAPNETAEEPPPDGPGADGSAGREPDARPSTRPHDPRGSSTPTEEEADKPDGPAPEESGPPRPQPSAPAPSTPPEPGPEPETAPSPGGTDDPPIDGAELEILDRKHATEAGVDGLLLRLTRTDGARETAPVQIGVNYAAYASAFGGDFGSRLRLFALQDCTPGASSGCESAIDLGAVNDAKTQTLSALAPAGAGDGTLLAVTASTDSAKGTGDFSATPLAPSSTWNVGEQTGDFSWSYPLASPNVAGGLAPEVGLSYSAQSVDGRTANSNNQTSWVGEGFSYEPGSIERRYELCQDDGNEVADQCWSRHNATLSLNGTSTELIIDADGKWHLRDDDGAKVERVTGTTNGDNDGEYWKVTTTDGTQYHFGRNRLPGWASGKSETKSTWTMPVYGNDAEEPCHDDTFAESWCQQAYKWNLDYVVDVHGNAMAYYYDKETNHYGRNFTSVATPYDRGGHLKRIDYGLRSDDVYGTAPARVNFTTGERCLPTDEFNCAAEKRTPANAKHWPDTPIDQLCGKDDTCAGKHSASFFTTQKLDKVTTQVHDGSSYATVDSWTFKHKFPAPGDGTDPALWLDAITHTGHTGGTASYPTLTFGGTAMENRVDSTSDGLAAMMKWRITSVYTETGGQVDVSYSAPECTPGSTPTPHDNTKRCYPVIWTPEGEEELTDWFHKYAVTQLAEIDLVAEQPDVITSYDYAGGAAWHFDDADGIVPVKRKTWSQFRGFGKVTVTKGRTGEARSQTEHLFYRGMDGDKQKTGTRTATITDSQGHTETDHDAFRGQTREVITRDGPGGAVISKTITTPWKKQTADRTYTWGTLRSHLTATKASDEYTALADGWRTTRTINTFDDHGFITAIDDQGDSSTAADDRCIRTTYARNTEAWLLDKVSQVETLATACEETASRPGDVVSDVRTSYDDEPFGTKPTRGLATTNERLADYTGGTPHYETVATTTYDSYGRALAATDADDNTTTTTYTAAAKGGPANKITITNALGHTATQELDARSSITALIDANKQRTDLSYDPFGRLSAVWLADRPKANNPRPSLKYEYHVRKDAPTSVITHRLNARAEYATSHEIYDGLLRPRQTQDAATGGGRVLTDTFHDSRGLQTKTRAPYYNDADPSDTLHIVNNDDEIPRQIQTLYDGAERVTDEIQVSRGEEQWRTTTRHLGDRTLTTAPEGGTATTTLTDARGRTTELRNHHGHRPEGDHTTTAYTYAKNGQPKTVTDPGGNTWTYTYDLRGRLTETDDPDAGSVTTTYDALDREATTTDARGNTLAHTYDALSRPTELRDDSADGSLRAKWTYDTKAKGQLTSAARYLDGDTYTTTILGYDPMNRPRAHEITIPQSEGELAGTYRFLTLYNPDGSIQSAKSPAAGGLAAETVVYGYDDLKRPTTVAGNHTIVSETTYAKTGNLVQREFSRGALGSPKTWVTRDHDEATDRLAMTSVVNEVGDGSLTTQNYDYDDAGNIRRIADEPTDPARPDDVQCFSYDGLQRLTDVWTPDATGGAACEPDPDDAQLGGDAPYWHSYTYDDVGSRLSETRHADSGSTVREYAPPADGEGPAHAVSAVDQTGDDGAGSSTYDYDASGNMIRRTTGDKDQTLTWDAEGRLATVGNGPGQTSFVHDADGQRLIRKEGPVSTLYLPGMEVTHTAGQDETEATRFFTHAGETVAMRADDNTLSWLFSDHHGSAQLSVHSTSGAAVQRRFTAFGEDRGSSETWPNQKGFVGGTKDASTELTQLGARSYDASIGRFISVDPILDPADPQQMHGYAYANNNPASLSDPDGLKPMRGDNLGKATGSATVRPRTKPATGTGRFTGPRYYGGGSGAGRGWGGNWGRSGGYGSGSGRSVAKVVRVDPYAGPSTDPLAESLDAAKSSVSDPSGAISNWLDDNWDPIYGIGNVIGLVVCIASSGAICAAGAVLLLIANIAMDYYRTGGELEKMNWPYHIIDALFIVVGGGIAWALFSRAGKAFLRAPGVSRYTLMQRKPPGRRTGDDDWGDTAFNWGVNAIQWIIFQFTAGVEKQVITPCTKEMKRLCV